MVAYVMQNLALACAALTAFALLPAALAQSATPRRAAVAEVSRPVNITSEGQGMARFGSPWAGGNFRVLFSRTDKGPPGGRAGVSLPDLHWYLQGVTVPYVPVNVTGGFPCEVYNCVKSLEVTEESNLQVYFDDQWRKRVRLSCFLFPAEGCKQFDFPVYRKELTSKRFDCAIDLGLPHGEGYTPVWENGVLRRRSKLECDAFLPELV